MVLRSERLQVALEPERGAEVRSARSLESGREFLFQSPWTPQPPPDRGADGDAWVRDWRGGWQLLFPNAGEACELRGQWHPFHGHAALARWSVRDEAADRATLEWHDDERGMSVERTTSVRDAQASAATLVINDSREAVPYAFVEHAIFGGAPFAGAGRVELPGGSILPLDAVGAPRAADEPWPHRDGADWSRLPRGPAARFGAVLGLPTGRARLVDDESGAAVTLTWPIAQLPYLWYWLESRATDEPPWGGETVCIGLEPATLPTADGIAAAAERGTARRLESGDSARFELTIAFEEVAA